MSCIRVNTSRLQRAVNAAQDVERPGLVVDRVEGGDDVEDVPIGRCVEVAHVADDNSVVVNLRWAASSLRMRWRSSERSMPTIRLRG
jgi:hypothetical protein